MRGFGKLFSGKGCAVWLLCLSLAVMFRPGVVYCSENVTYQDVSFKLYDEIAVVTIPAFHERVCEQTLEILQELNDDGVANIILDLRGNIGGLFDEAVDTARLFIKDGIICTLYIEGREPVEYHATGTEADYNVAVLVNAFTASSAELLASVIQESGCGVLIGTQTFGKNSVQRVTPTDNGENGKSTVGYFLTRNGADISGAGLTPDYKVRVDRRNNTDTDDQLQKALELNISHPLTI
ncbi:MAG: hypothetical protein LBS19_00075 [Clostridiales bacterium]|jgi:carboxyl-terminal processing protease|nr:hypothetical protein [Clostridiales bacterium]